MIEGKIKLELPQPEKTLKSIKSENLTNLKSYVKENKLITEFKFKNIGQAISSLDDLLKCVDVSKEVIMEWKN